MANVGKEPFLARAVLSTKAGPKQRQNKAFHSPCPWPRAVADHQPGFHQVHRRRRTRSADRLRRGRPRAGPLLAHHGDRRQEMLHGQPPHPGERLGDGRQGRRAVPRQPRCLPRPGRRAAGAPPRWPGQSRDGTVTKNTAYPASAATDSIPPHRHEGDAGGEARLQGDDADGAAASRLHRPCGAVAAGSHAIISS